MAACIGHHYGLETEIRCVPRGRLDADLQCHADDSDGLDRESRSAISNGVPTNADIAILSRMTSFGRGSSSGTSANCGESRGKVDTICCGLDLRCQAMAVRTADMPATSTASTHSQPEGATTDARSQSKTDRLLLDKPHLRTYRAKCGVWCPLRRRMPLPQIHRPRRAGARWWRSPLPIGCSSRLTSRWANTLEPWTSSAPRCLARTTRRVGPADEDRLRRTQSRAHQLQRAPSGSHRLALAITEPAPDEEDTMISTTAGSYFVLLDELQTRLSPDEGTAAPRRSST